MGHAYLSAKYIPTQKEIGISLTFNGVLNSMHLANKERDKI